MKEKLSPLYSEYIIDGVAQELTPAEMLGGGSVPEPRDGTQIIDESLDPKIACDDYDSWKVQDYLHAVSSFSSRSFPVEYSSQYAKILAARSLVDVLWRDGHFRIGDLQLQMGWQWDGSVLGRMAAFYSSVQAVVDYVDSLGLTISSYAYEEGKECGFVSSATLLAESEDDEDLLTDMPFRTENPEMGDADRHPSVFVPDPDSWIIYVPLETASFRLGGSCLSQAIANEGGSAPELEDPDYFLDCYEVLREMVEDDIVVAGATVGDGGLMAALRSMSGGRTGVRANVHDLMKAYGTDNPVKVLFGEVPGVVIQVRDNDFDYVDAEFTLQDVSFFPLGHPTPGKGDIRVETSDKSGIQTILESLIRSQSSEGED